MGKKVAFTKGSNKVNFKKNPLNVSKTVQQKKPKAVKLDIKKVNIFDNKTQYLEL